MRITYDEPKRQANIAKHGFDFADLTLDFFLSARVDAAKAGRFLAVGDFEGRTIVAVVFRPLGSEALSVISMRPANRKETGRKETGRKETGRKERRHIDD